MGKEELKEIQSGKSALIVTKIDGQKKWVPECNNLGSNAADFTMEEHKFLLKKRRKEISPYHQFPTLDNLAKLDRSKLELNKDASATVLEKNMLACMPPKVRELVNAFGGKASHHVVEGTDLAACKSRAILEKFNIDINGPENGIFLPADKQSIFKGVLHKTNHTEAYSEEVYNRLKDCKIRDEVISVLLKIKHDLYDGKLNLEGERHSINKNDVNV